MTDYQLSEKVLEFAFRVHTALGPGLLESTYEECLVFELRRAAYFVEQQKPIPLVYEDVKLDCGFRLDVIVQNRLILEIKAIECFEPIHTAQVLTYLKLLKLRYGLLLNFNVKSLKNGIKRVANGYSN